MSARRGIALAVGVALVAAACTSGGTEPPSSNGDGAPEVSTFSNDGGDREGHTPTGFPGTGMGLFVGDNLNPSFPEGIGVQTYLTFDLPNGITVDTATLTSNALNVSGTPFDDLGNLLAEPVVYAEFGPHLFDLEAAGEAVVCTVSGNSSIECDVTSAVQDAVGAGATVAQFRLRFESPADGDGQQDLALFFRTGSNTNEPGLFDLIVTPGS